MLKRGYVRTDGGTGTNKDTHINKIRNNLVSGDVVKVDDEDGVVLDIKRCVEQVKGKEWKAGDLISVEDIDGDWFSAEIVGSSLANDDEQMNIQFEDGTKDDWYISEFCHPKALVDHDPIEIIVKVKDGSIRKFNREGKTSDPNHLNNIMPQYKEEDGNIIIKNIDPNRNRRLSGETYEFIREKAEERTARTKSANSKAAAAARGAAAAAVNALTYGMTGIATSAYESSKSASSKIKIEDKIEKLEQKIDKNIHDINKCCSDVLGNTPTATSPLKILDRKKRDVTPDPETPSDIGISPVRLSGADMEGSPQQSSESRESTQDSRINTTSFTPEQLAEAEIDESTKGGDEGGGTAGGGKYKRKKKTKRNGKSNHKKKTKRIKKTKRKNKTKRINKKRSYRKR